MTTTISNTEALKRAPLWVIKFIYLDMQHFATQIADDVNYEGELLQSGVVHRMQITDPHIIQIVQHLDATTRCLINYAYVNNICIEDLNEDDQDYLQAKTTWDVVTGIQMEILNPKLSLLERYSDRSYMYCLLLWNCAQQVLLNKVDVYNDCIGEFFEWMIECSDRDYNEERTQPLFKLISQLGHFHINLPYS